MKRVTLFNNGSDVDGKAVVITHSFEELIAVATKKCGIPVKRIFTAQGGEIDEIELIRDDDILYVSAGESFVRMENKSTQSSDSFPCATQGQMVVSKADFEKLCQEFEKQKQMLSVIYVGEVASIVRDFVHKISSCPDMVNLFLQTCNISADDFNKLKNETYTHPQARNEIAHVNNKDMEKFTVTELGECFDTLGYDKSQVFRQV